MLTVAAALAVLGVAVGGTVGLQAPARSQAAVTSTVSAPPAPVTISTPAAPTWGKCPDLAGLECADLVVPLDYARPDGERITLAISRRRHTAAPFRGVIVVNPGGPGAAGRELASSGANLARGVGDSYDWVGFDPRGVGATRPALRCDPTYFSTRPTRYVPDSTAIQEQWIAASKAYAAACGAASGRLLPHMRTIDLVRDLESIRLALRVPKISYWGNSYGSLLGQVYASRYPDRVERMVLDGVVDADLSWYQSNVAQNSAISAGFDAFLRWMANHHKALGVGSDPGALKARFMQRLQALTVTPAAGGKVGAAALTDVAVQAAYGVGTWAASGHSVARLLSTGDATTLVPEHSAAEDNARAGYLAVECGETTWPSMTQMIADAQRQHPEHPLMTWSNTWMNAPCAFWPIPSQPRVSVDPGTVRAPILLVSETYDGATPFAGAVATRDRLPTARLLEGVGGTTHSSAIAGGSCVAGVVADFLESGRLPARVSGSRADQQCAPLPAPTP